MRQVLAFGSSRPIRLPRPDMSIMFSVFSWFSVFSGLGSLALALEAAGPVAANPFGVERRGGDAIAAITSLTPEQARELVAKRTDATARIGTGKAALAFARGGVTLRGALMLPSLESLDAETAAVLADYDEGPLFLDGLTELSADVAGELRKFKGGPRSYASFGRCLSLAGLETLSPEAAAELAAFGGEALFLGVTELSEPAFRSLMKVPRRLYLPRLARIPAGAAESMADYKGPGLSILGLTTLSPEEAEVFTRLGNKWNGRLPNVQNISPETAAVLAGVKKENEAVNPAVFRMPKVVRLELDGAKLSDQALAEVTRFPSILLLRGLNTDTLSEGKLAALAAFAGDRLSLVGLDEPPAALAELLEQFQCKTLDLHPWEWNFGRNRPVTPADARLVAAYAGRLGKTCVLPGIEGFETPAAVEIAKILAAAPGTLSIPNLRRVSAKTLTALIATGNVELPPIDALTLIEEPDGSSGDDFVVPEDFPTRGRR